jgi:hypothetical protein
MIQSHERYLCSINPLEALVSGILPGLFGGGGAPAAAAAPTPITPPPPTAAAPPAQNPTGSAKPANAGAQQSFIGAAATPQQSSGQKTLLGQ